MIPFTGAGSSPGTSNSFILRRTAKEPSLAWLSVPHHSKAPKGARVLGNADRDRQGVPVLGGGEHGKDERKLPSEVTFKWRHFGRMCGVFKDKQGKDGRARSFRRFFDFPFGGGELNIGWGATEPSIH